jgi:hypothetical protein
MMTQRKQSGVVTRVSLAAALTAVALIGVLAAVATPGRRADAQVQEGYMYTAAFTCVDEVGTFDPAFLPGRYRTAVNVHNPQGHTVSLSKKAVIATSEETHDRGHISKFKEDELGLDDALSIDCTTVLTLFDQQPQSVGNGFVIIESKEPLDVVAVYTQSGETGSSVDVECIQPKQIRGEVVMPTQLGC